MPKRIRIHGVRFGHWFVPPLARSEARSERRVSKVARFMTAAVLTIQFETSQRRRRLYLGRTSDEYGIIEKTDSRFCSLQSNKELCWGPPKHSRAVLCSLPPWSRFSMPCAVHLLVKNFTSAMNWKSKNTLRKGCKIWVKKIYPPIRDSLDANMLPN